MRGVSAIIALVLILLITISLGTMLYFYLSNSQQDITGLIEQQQEIELRKVSSEMKILGADPNSGNITVRNTGRFDIDKFNLFLNGMQTEIVPLNKLTPGQTGVVSPTTKPLPGDYEIKITATYAEAYGYLVILGENINPQWSLVSQNSSTGTAFELSSYWTDNVMLVNAILSTNETGSWVNSSTLSLETQTAWSNFTWSGSLLDGETVSWRIYANDSDGNENVTNTMTFTYTSDLGNPNPEWWNPYVGNYRVYSNWTDAQTEIDYTWLSTDETGAYVNYTAREASYVIDDLPNDASWVPGAPWKSFGISPVAIANNTNGYIRDGLGLVINFINIDFTGIRGACVNGTYTIFGGNDVLSSPIDFTEFESIVYWVYYQPQGPQVPVTSITVGNWGTANYCKYSTEVPLAPGWNRIEFDTNPTFWAPVDGPSCEITLTNIDFINIWFAPNVAYRTSCEEYEAFFTIDEVYLRSPPHDDFKTMFTWKNNSIATGNSVNWKIFANDTDGNENVTSVGTITAP